LGLGLGKEEGGGLGWGWVGGRGRGVAWVGLGLGWGMGEEVLHGSGWGLGLGEEVWYGSGWGRGGGREEGGGMGRVGSRGGGVCGGAEIGVADMRAQRQVGVGRTGVQYSQALKALLFLLHGSVDMCCSHLLHVLSGCAAGCRDAAAPAAAWHKAATDAACMSQRKYATADHPGPKLLQGLHGSSAACCSHLLQGVWVCALHLWGAYSPVIPARCCL
jgi:hypothetical protein